MAVAQEMFFEGGYGISMSSIAARIGGSKTTLWTYFPTKAELFEAIIDRIVAEYGSIIERVPLLPGDLRKTLSSFGRAVVTTILSPTVVSLHRLVVGEAERFPELGRLYYEKGPGRAQFRLSRFLKNEMNVGSIATGDSDRMAAFFLQMCQAGAVQRSILAQPPEASQAEMAGDVDTAVSSFLHMVENRVK